MVQITQTDDEVKIVIELNRLITRKPDIVLLPTYIKFNNPPIFFERHLAQEIDELSSFCRIFKNEARIVLMKKQKGHWPELFLKLSKEELMKRRLEIADLLVERNKERDQKALERFDQKRRHEIEKEVKRETAMRERVKKFEQDACREMLMIDGKETHPKQKPDSRPTTASARQAQRQHSTTQPSNTVASPPPPRVLPAVRTGGRISVCFSNFSMPTPKRESTAHMKMPFIDGTIHETDNDDNNNETSLNDIPE